MRWAIYADGRPIADGTLAGVTDPEAAATDLLAEHAAATGLSALDMRALTCEVGEAVADGRDW